MSDRSRSSGVSVERNFLKPDWHGGRRLFLSIDGRWADQQLSSRWSWIWRKRWQSVCSSLGLTGPLRHPSALESWWVSSVTTAGFHPELIDYTASWGEAATHPWAPGVKRSVEVWLTRLGRRSEDEAAHFPHWWLRSKRSFTKKPLDDGRMDYVCNGSGEGGIGSRGIIITFVIEQCFHLLLK